MSTVFAAGKYVTWGVVSVSVTNLLIVGLMLVIFVLALLLPFPRERVAAAPPAEHGEEDPT